MKNSLNIILLGKRIRDYRVSQHKSIREFSELCGVSERYLADIERGIKAPKLDTFVRFANVMGVSSEYLLQDSLTAANKTNLIAYSLERLPLKQQKFFQDFILRLVDIIVD